MATTKASASTWTEDLVTSLLGLWVVAAVHLDGRAHFRNEPDSFFTSWHLLLYTGFTALTLWIVFLGVRRSGLPTAATWRTWQLPTGYGAALAGAILFAAGGLADMAWHLAFGIEAGIEALLSPSHLLLLTSGVLVVSAPLRAALRKPEARTLKDFLPAALSLTSITAVVAFALSYLSGFENDAPTRAVPVYPEGTPQHYAVEVPAIAGLGSYLVTTLLLIIALLIVLHRTRVPAGTVTLFLLILAALAVTMVDFKLPWVVAAAGIAGAAADLLITRLWPRDPRLARVTIAAVIPALLWPGQLIALAAEYGVRWPIELVSGVVVSVTLLSVGIALLLEWLTATRQPVTPQPVATGR